MSGKDEQTNGGDGPKVRRASGRAGPPRKFSENQEVQLAEFLRANPRSTVEDVGVFAKQVLGVAASGQTICKVLKHQGISKRKVARELAEVGVPVANLPSAKKRYGYRPQHRPAPAPGGYPSSLTDAEWALVADLFEHKGGGKRPEEERRHMLDAVLYVVRGGSSWRMVPANFPKWNNVYATFRRWVRDNVMETMYDRLRAMWRAREDRAVEPTGAVLDSQSVKTSPQGGPKGYDGGKKLTGRKRHLLVDTLGLLLAVMITPANVQDRDAAAPILIQGKAKYPTIKKTYVDCGYAGSKTAAAAAATGVELEVVKRPHHQNRTWASNGTLPLFPNETSLNKPFPILPKRWIVERNNAWNERPRRMNRDHDRLLPVSTAWIWLVEGRMLLTRLVSPRSDAVQAGTV